jgi:hypothetical protein
VPKKRAAWTVDAVGDGSERRGLGVRWRVWPADRFYSGQGQRRRRGPAKPGEPLSAVHVFLAVLIGDLPRL